MKTLYIADIRSNESDGKSTGHYIPVAKMYQKLFSDYVHVKVAGGPIYKRYFNESELLDLPYTVRHTSIFGRLHILRNCIYLFKAAKGQTIVIQHSAVITALIAIALFYRKDSELYMILYNNEGLRYSFGRLMYRFAKNKINGIICPNDMVGRLYNRPYCIVPDYIYSGDDKNKKKKSFEEKLYDFCIVGRIAPGKGVVESAKKIANTKYSMIIAGKPENEDLANELRKICADADNITLKLGYVSDEDYASYLSKSKYTILNYQGEYSKRSSGVVYDTIFAGVPVVGCRCSALQFVEDEGIGYIYKSLEDFNPEEIMNPNLYKKYQAAIDSYRHRHRQYITKLADFLKIS